MGSDVTGPGLVQAAEDVDDARAALLALVPCGAHVAEIGVHRGDFSARILRTLAPSRLLLVDPYRAVADPGHREAWYGGDVTQDEMDARERAMRARLAAPIAAGIVVPVRASSVEAASGVPDASLDAVYLDGDHAYEAVAADLAAWWPKLVPGGLMAGDDYMLGGWWGDGVVRAFDGFAERTGCEVALRLGTQVALRR